MEFHFIQMKPTKGYFTMVDPNSRARVMCFSNRQTAEKCSRYLCEFRAKHGKWPHFDMGKGITKVTSDKIVRNRTSFELMDFLDIVSMDEEDLNVVALYNNTSFMYCHDFKINDKSHDAIDIGFRGQEIDAEVDIKYYTDVLEINYRLK